MLDNVLVRLVAEPLTWCAEVGDVSNCDIVWFVTVFERSAQGFQIRRDSVHFFVGQVFERDRLCVLDDWAVHCRARALRNAEATRSTRRIGIPVQKGRARVRRAIRSVTGKSPGL